MSKLICCVAVILAGLGGPTTAGIIYVDLCGDDTWTGADPTCTAPNGPKRTIQAAIVIAVNGDEVVVAPGVYFEIVDFLGKEITLRSSGGPQTTSINANGGGDVVTCDGCGPNSLLEGFTILGGGGPSTAAGMMIINNSSPTVVNCIFRNNNGGAYGGGIFVTSPASNPTIYNCVFIENTAQLGGGISTLGAGSVTVTNCLFVENSAYGQNFGGGMDIDATTATITNCTFYGNSAAQGGAILNRGGSNTTITNSIFWNNGIEDTPASSTYVAFSDVQGGWFGLGTMNIDTDPLFADQANGDLHLLPGSPCIDAADGTAVPSDLADLDGDGHTTEQIPVDLDGNTRFVDGDENLVTIVDMGAFEFQGPISAFGACCLPSGTCNVMVESTCTGFGGIWRGSGTNCADFNGNGIADTCEVIGVCKWDHNGDGVVNVPDLLELLANWGPCP